MTTLFHCPNCNAPLNYDGGDSYVVSCTYCNSSVVVPENLRRPKTDQIQIVINSPNIEHPKARIATGSCAQLIGEFGGPGIGPGLFNDTRHVAIDGAGYVYTGDYTGGRIQRFSPDGKFVSLWTVNAKKPLTSLAADRGGKVYAAQGGDLTRFDGNSGQLLGTLEYEDGWGFQDVATTADGGLIASWYKNRDDLVRFDWQGKAIATIRAAISSLTEESELNVRVAADGLGNLYALGTFHNAVFKFNPSGKFVNRFGSDGDEPGQFRAPSAIAVDGQGRVYVADFKGIQVFDPDGRYRARIGVTGPASGLAFDARNELWVTARTKLFKYRLLVN